jgi:hypothetical protein
MGRWFCIGLMAVLPQVAAAAPSADARDEIAAGRTARGALALRKSAQARRPRPAAAGRTVNASGL